MIMQDKIVKALILFITVSLLCTVSHRAFAQDEGGSTQEILDSALDKFSEEEKIAFAFYSLSDKKPDYKKWLMSTDEYQWMRPMQRQHLLVHGKKRLQLGLDVFNVRRDTFEIVTNVGFIEPQGAQRQNFIAEYGEIPVTLDYFETPDGQSFFPMRVAGMWIAVVPHDLLRYSTFGVSAEEYEKIMAVFPKNQEDKERRAFVTIVMRGASVDDGTPLAVGDLEAWLMLAEIGALEVRAVKNGPVIWKYEAPWLAE